MAFIRVLLAVLNLMWLSPLAEQPDCRPIETMTGGERVAWQGYPQGWDLPSDLKKTARVDFETGGVWAYHSESEGARYIVVFLSYEQTTGADGQHLGAHDFCGPYRIDDE